LVADIIAAVKDLAEFNNVRLVWVPGHGGVSGNEKADVLAKQALLHTTRTYSGCKFPSTV